MAISNVYLQISFPFVAFWPVYSYPQINAILFWKILIHTPPPALGRGGIDYRKLNVHMKCITVRCSNSGPCPQRRSTKEILLLYYWEGGAVLVVVKTNPLSVSMYWNPCFLFPKRLGLIACQRLTLENPPETLLIEQGWVYCWNEGNVSSVSKQGIPGRCFDRLWMLSPKSFKLNSSKQSVIGF